MNIKEKIESITIDDLIKFEIEEAFKKITGKEPNGSDKTHDKRCLERC